MTDVKTLNTHLNERYSSWIERSTIKYGELTLDIKPPHIADICVFLRDQPEFDFKVLLDVCGVDYLQYGLADWETNSTTETGFSRGVTTHPGLGNSTPAHTVAAEEQEGFVRENPAPPCRFAVVYHLLSITNNHRLRLKVNLPDDSPLIVDSVVDIWPSANWFEREAFDLFGILFRGHPDLRRILTDYGFVGHPFRKDFPLIGKVEARYDANMKRVIYEPVSIPPRVLEPKVIRHDNRYQIESMEPKDGR